MVEHWLPKPRVAGSNPVSRSNKKGFAFRQNLFCLSHNPLGQQLTQGLEVGSTIHLLAFRRVELVKAIAVALLYFRANDLHRAVYQSVLFREGLTNDGNRGGQPAVGELASGRDAELVDRGLDGLGCGTQLLLVRGVGAERLYPLLVRYDDSRRVGALVVVDVDLGDERRGDDRLLHTSGLYFSPSAEISRLLKRPST